MQLEEDVWQEQLERNNFKTIFFGHRDITPWGVAFMEARMNDPEWDVVYMDDFSVIFVKINQH